MLCTLIASVLSACEDQDGGQVIVNDVRVLAPAIGGHASVAYFSIDNNSDNSTTVRRVSSPQFGSVEMHESTIEGGVSRMRRIESIEIAGSSQIEFVPGGRHIMLMQPAANVVPGALITLEIQLDDGLLLVSAELQDRISPP